MLNLANGSWLVINDDVMGGHSSARVSATGEGLRFEGHLSLADGGGFSSIRRAVAKLPADPGRVRLEVRGDGRPYQLRLRTDARFDGLSWRVEFPTTDEWETLEFAISEFEAVFRGRRVASARELQGGQIRQVGFLLADGQEGEFRLDVRRVEFLAGETPPGPH